jgi:hypothetical protein
MEDAEDQAAEGARNALPTIYADKTNKQIEGPRRESWPFYLMKITAIYHQTDE